VWSHIEIEAVLFVPSALPSPAVMLLFRVFETLLRCFRLSAFRRLLSVVLRRE
jgi:hypothetical protein